METTFTPGAGLLGGALIGLAAALLLLGEGRLAGVSGILGRGFFSARGDRGWRLAFLLGLPLGAWFATHASADALGFHINQDPLVLVAGGLLVGVGTQLGNGCTSGHGVCGMSRGSRRSAAATATFMATALLTVFLVRHGLGGRGMKLAFSLGCGIVFGAGLALSGMTNPAKVLGFLDVLGSWDPTLALVMGSALAVSSLGYRLVRRRERSWLGDAIALPTRQELDASLLGGSALFGVGWGLVGVCPGPALANLSRASFENGIFVVAMLAGVVGYRWLAERGGGLTS